MPRYRFLGFPTGLPVTVSLAQGAATAGPITVNAWGQPASGGGTGALSIIARTDQRLIAPTGVWFEARAGAGFIVESRERTPDLWNTYDAAFHEIDYDWTITRPAGAPASGERDAFLNVPNVWKGRNTARGPQIAVVMDVPGVYTITCTARDWAGNVGMTTWTATVGDPAVAFSGASTICVTSLAPSDPDAPAGAQQFTTIDAARTALVALPGDGRILFKRGEVHTFATSFPVNSDQDRGLSNFRCGPFGTGAKPIIRSIGDAHFYRPSGSAVTQDTAVYGLRFEAEWDETTETGNAGFGIDVQFASTHLLVHQCEFSGHDIAVYASGNSFNFRRGNPLRGLLPTNIVSETQITNWTNMGIFSPAPSDGLAGDAVLAVIHSEIARSPLALVGRQNDRSTSNAHGPIRWSAGMFYSQASYYFSNAGWSAGGPPSFTTSQPCIRCVSAAAVTGSPGQSTGDMFSSVQNIVCEGGQSISFGATDGDGGTHHIPNNALVDGLLAVGCAQHVNVPNLNTQGATTVRNSTVVVPGTQVYGNSGNPLVQWGPNGNINNPEFTARNFAQPQRWFNNTFVNLRTAAQNGNNPADIPIFAQSRVDQWNSKVIENNVYHAPNQGTPATADGPFAATTIPGFTPRYVGPRMNFGFLTTTLPQPMPAIPPGGTVPFPYPAGTSQAHFAANPLGPRSVFLRTLGNAAANRYFAHQGGCSITFTPTAIVVTNTSSDTWENTSGVYQLSLDRRNELPGPDTARATPASLPVLWTPATGSPAIGGATEQVRPRQDILLRTRGTPVWRGAVQPV